MRKTIGNKTGEDSSPHRAHVLGVGGGTNNRHNEYINSQELKGMGLLGAGWQREVKNKTRQLTIFNRSERVGRTERVRSEGRKRVSQGDVRGRRTCQTDSYSKAPNVEACLGDSKVVSVDGAGLARGTQEEQRLAR